MRSNPLMHTTLLVAALLLAVSSGCAPSTEVLPPNIIIILTDDQGWGDVSYNGNSNLATPHIDRIAARGATLNRFYVSPVCSPTRAELLTGRYHPRAGVTGTSAGAERMDLDEVTLAEMFKAAGYATGAFGKWHSGSQAPYHPNARGFGEFYGFTSGHWGNYFSPPLEHNGTIVSGRGYLPDDITDKALAFMESHPDQPFLVYLPYNTPHSPMQVPDAYWNAFASHPLAQRHREPDLEVLDHTRAALAMVANIDWNVGRIASHLDSLGLTERTIVLYFSDNGPNGARWNGGMKGRKGSTDEGGVRSPFVIQWPGVIEASLEIDHIAAAIDLFPTLLELAGVATDPGLRLDGVSLAPLLRGEPYAHQDRFVFSHWRGRTSVRSQRFRLDHAGQLFDMQADPGQHEDVAVRFGTDHAALLAARADFEATVLAELPASEQRPFTVGHPDFERTILPVRDAKATGAIRRSNRYPNDSFFTEWTSVEDSILWHVEILAPGTFEATVYYSVPEGSQGSAVALSFGDHRVAGQVATPYDPPLRGMEHDRTPRIESYVKNFRPLVLGNLSLPTGVGTMALTAQDMPGASVMDVKMVALRRIEADE